MKKILIINANYYNKITKKLTNTAVKFLKQRKFNIYTLEVSGILELPYALRKNIKKFNGFIVIGCVIKGQTPHFDIICKSSFDAILNLSISFNKPITNGIITSLNKKQAYERCGIIKSKKPNKGLEAAKALFSLIKNGIQKN
tara:strand:+ start:183 stop:608 length:426 start_codon:yes stop_codon:yes gene_type:complete